MRGDLSSLVAFYEAVCRTSLTVYSGKSWRQKYHRIKYLIRCFLFFKQTKEWIRMLQSPSFDPLRIQNPRLYLKLQRPYLMRGLGVDEKFKCLRCHFDFLHITFSAVSLSELCSPSGMLLCTWTPREADCFKLWLRSGAYEKEGELTLVLEDLTARLMVNTMTFSVSEWEGGERGILIGGIQGIRSQEGRALIVNATRAMFGMRPKSVLLHVLRLLAKLWNISVLRAVGNSRHVCLSKMKEIGSSADFDSFWKESGGQIDFSGVYNLPLHALKKDLSVLTASKRAAYRKRESMLQSMDAAIHGRIRSLGEA
jgi:uncharacterized protein VirK/YbjX